MHDFSLPSADRVDPSPPAPRPEPAGENSRKAQCLAISGGFFAGWSYTGKPRTVFTLARAKVFLSQKHLDAEIKELKRYGMAATPVDVTLRIGA